MSTDTINVVVRVRPSLPKDIIHDNHFIVSQGEISVKGSTQDTYAFDHIFDSSTKNFEVYEVIKPIVQSATEGINGCIFAYGQTSSGKTHSLMGSTNEAGIIPLAIKHIFSIIQANTARKFFLRASYLEIYNEKIQDLLNPKEVNLKIREDNNGNLFLSCKEFITHSEKELHAILMKGNRNRQVEETKMNERSSRSHAIFKIVIESTEICESDEEIPGQVSTLHFVDLCGSERPTQTQAQGARLKEGGHINRSLSTLSLVIQQLSENHNFINFRDSKLTRLLSNGLGGNSKTLILATITPTYLEDSLSTLKFAKQAKKIEVKPKINEILTNNRVLKKYQRIEADLKMSKDKINALEEEKEEYLRKMQEMEINRNKILVNILHNTSIPSLPTKSTNRRHTFANQELVFVPAGTRFERKCSTDRASGEYNFFTPLNNVEAYQNTPAPTPGQEFQFKLQILNNKYLKEKQQNEELLSEIEKLKLENTKLQIKPEPSPGQELHLKDISFIATGLGRLEGILSNEQNSLNSSTNSHDNTILNISSDSDKKTDEILDAEKLISEQEKIIEDLNTILKDKQSRIAVLERVHASDRDQLLKSINKLRTDQDELQKKLDLRNAEYALLQEQLDLNTKRILKLSTELDKNRSEKDELTRRSTKLEQDLRDKINASTKRTEELLEELNQYESKNFELNEKLFEIEQSKSKECALLQEQLNLSTKRIIELSTELDENRGKKDELAGRSTKLEQDLQDKINASAKRREELLEELNQYKSKNFELNEKLFEIEQSKSKECALLQEQLNLKTKRIIELSTELDENRSKRDELARRSTKLEQDLRDKTNASAKRTEELLEELNQYKSKNFELKEKLFEIEQSGSKECALLQEQLNLSTKRIIELSTELDENRSKKDELAGRSTKLEQDLRDKINASAKRTEELLEELNQYKSKSLELKEKLFEIEQSGSKERALLQEQLNLKTKRIIELSTELDENRSKKDELAGRSTKLEQDLQDKTNASAKRTEELLEELNQYKSKNFELKEKLFEIEQSGSKECALLQEQLNLSTKRIIELSTELDENRSKKDELAGRSTKLEQDLQDKINASAKRREELLEELNQYKSKSLELKEKLFEIEQSGSKERALLQEQLNLKTKRIIELSTELDENRSKRDELARRSTKLEQELRYKINASTKRTEELLEELNQYKSKSFELNEKLFEIEQSESKAIEHNNEIKSLSEELKTTNTKLEMMTQDFNNSLVTINKYKQEIKEWSTMLSEEKIRKNKLLEEVSEKEEYLKHLNHLNTKLKSEGKRQDSQVCDIKKQLATKTTEMQVLDFELQQTKTSLQEIGGNLRENVLGKIYILLQIIEEADVLSAKLKTSCESKDKNSLNDKPASPRQTMEDKENARQIFQENVKARRISAHDDRRGLLHDSDHDKIAINWDKQKNKLRWELNNLEKYLKHEISVGDDELRKQKTLESVKSSALENITNLEFTINYLHEQQEFTNQCNGCLVFSKQITTLKNNIEGLRSNLSDKNLKSLGSDVPNDALTLMKTLVEYFSIGVLDNNMKKIVGDVATRLKTMESKKATLQSTDNNITYFIKQVLCKLQELEGVEERVSLRSCKSLCSKRQLFNTLILQFIKTLKRTLSFSDYLLQPDNKNLCIIKVNEDGLIEDDIKIRKIVQELAGSRHSIKNDYEMLKEKYNFLKVLSADRHKKVIRLTKENEELKRCETGQPKTEPPKNPQKLQLEQLRQKYNI